MKGVELRFRGVLPQTGSAMYAALVERRLDAVDETVRATVRRIIAAVRERGDAALREQAMRFDGVQLEALEVPRARCRAALDNALPEWRRALERAAANIERAHRAFLPAAIEIETEPGVVVGRRPFPVERAGVYVPGGRAVYPSSVLMGAIPARVAGVRDVVVCTPPATTGRPADAILAACELARVDRVFAIGGAGAIAALAFGTASVPRVSRIVGPGNAYVAEAKLQVTGQVAIDAPAGPSELLVVTDCTAGLESVAREMVAQAEHDPRAVVLCVMIGDPARIAALETLLAARVAASDRQEIVRAALAAAGGLLAADTLDAAIEFANAYAPEHLLLAIASPQSAAARFQVAGAVFLGAHSSVAFGDYLTGANHVLPTAGLARSYSGLSTSDFMRWTSYQHVTPEAAQRLAPDTARLAIAEGLPGHADAARQWEGVAP